MNPFEFHQNQTRRQMIGLGARGLGALGAAQSVESITVECSRI